MLKRVGVAALLAACSSQEDITRVTDGIPGRGAGSPSGARPSALPGASASAGSSSPALVWAVPASPSAAPALPGPSGAAPAQVAEVARQHLTGAASAHRYSPAKVAELTLDELHDTGRGAIIARFDRRVNGLKVFGQQVSVAMDRDLNALALSGDVSGELPLVAKAAGAATGFALPPEDAVVIAVADITGVSLARDELGAAQPLEGDYEAFSLAPGALSRLGAPPSAAPARARPTLFPGQSKQLLPAYYVEADVGPDAARRPRYFGHVISAVDGAILWRRDLVADEAFTYRVYADDSGLSTPWDGPQGTALSPHPTREPTPGLASSFVPSQLVTLESLAAVGVLDPWLPDGATETLGNNVDAYLDITDPSGFDEGQDFRGQVSAPGVFGAVFDPVLDADTSEEQRTAAVTQLFYDINWFHDWYYAAGFTEAAGNAQADNFGRGGLGADAIRAEAQDFGGTNNANMLTPADGQSPRMQMYLWDFGPTSLAVTGPEAVAGSYDSGAADFAPRQFDAAGPIVRADPVDACAPLVGDYAGAIVLIDRGGEACGANAFGAKAAAAQQAGAVGAIIANVPTSNAPETAPQAGGTPPVEIEIGVVTLNLADGDRLRAALGDGAELAASMERDARLRDGDLDNQIVAHEWGHYISNRLVADAAGLGTNMASGLGEGWGDFHALLMTVRPEDAGEPGNEAWSGLFSVGGYASGADYFGVRRYPYSTDLTRDPLTFQHTGASAVLPEGIPRAGGGENVEVHNLGEVWATMLWECYAALLRDTLGPAPRLSFAEARDRMRDYIVAAYKLTPANPTLLEARDALLAAALANDEVDVQRFGQAFAKRGAGVFAVAPNRFDPNNEGVIESYEFGEALDATSASLSDDLSPECGNDGILDSGETGTLRVVFRNIGDAPSDGGAASVAASVPGVEFPDGAAIDIPPLPILGSAEVGLRVTLGAVSGITPVEFTVQVADAGAGEPRPQVYGFATNVDELPNQSRTDGAESSHVAWSVVSSEPTISDGSRWQRTALSTTEHLYRCPSAPAAGTVDFVSPPLQVAQGEPLRVSFQHRFSFETDGTAFYDGGVIEASTDDGATWTDVGEQLGYGGALFPDSENPLGGRSAFVGESPGYPELTSASLELGQRFAGSTVRLRFRVASDAGTTSPGWDLDQIEVEGIENAPFDLVVAQPAACGGPP